MKSYLNIGAMAALLFTSACTTLPEKSDTTETNDFHCSTLEESYINITGSLALDSKGVPLLDFVD
ncbi:MAG: hypothetical protein ACPGVT_08300, partial [Maricaulaceae bacterium]